MKIIISSLFLLCVVNAFRMKQLDPTIVKVKEGGSFKVICRADNWFEVTAYSYTLHGTL